MPFVPASGAPTYVINFYEIACLSVYRRPAPPRQATPATRGEAMRRSGSQGSCPCCCCCWCCFFAFCFCSCCRRCYCVGEKRQIYPVGQIAVALFSFFTFFLLPGRTFGRRKEISRTERAPIQVTDSQLSYGPRSKVRLPPLGGVFFYFYFFCFSSSSKLDALLERRQTTQQSALKIKKKLWGRLLRPALARVERRGYSSFPTSE